MKNDLDALMEQANIDVLLATGPAQYNPAMVYLTGGGHVTVADYIKKKGEPAVLFHVPMERDEARNTGLKLISYTQYPFQELLKEAGGDRLQAATLRYRKMLEDLGITRGRMALYGVVEVAPMLAIIDRLRSLLPGLEIVVNIEKDVLDNAMLTKDDQEIARIRRIGQITTTVVGRTADFLCSQKTKDGCLVSSDGEPVTIGKVKSLINMWLAELGADNPEGTIFAQGRDAGIPHSAGRREDVLRLGQTIVYDIFPCEANGGYFYDFTRTWCLGYAPDEASKLYEDVLSVYNKMEAAFQVGHLYSEYHEMSCRLFEELGHKTIMKDLDIEEGYVHLLGHGIGLRVHERPSCSPFQKAPDKLLPGMAFTSEPGLYYPERGLGVRLENTLFVRPDGKMEVVVEYPMDLVLPVK